MKQEKVTLKLGLSVLEVEHDNRAYQGVAPLYSPSNKPVKTK
jgi:hypothetical protein